MNQQAGAQDRQCDEQQWERRKTPGGDYDLPLGLRGPKVGGGGGGGGRCLARLPCTADPSTETAGMSLITVACSGLFDPRRTPLRVIRLQCCRSVFSTCRTGLPITQKSGGRSGPSTRSWPSRCSVFRGATTFRHFIRHVSHIGHASACFRTQDRNTRLRFTLITFAPAHSNDYCVCLYPIGCNSRLGA